MPTEQLEKKVQIAFKGPSIEVAKLFRYARPTRRCAACV